MVVTMESRKLGAFLLGGETMTSARLGFRREGRFLDARNKFWGVRQMASGARVRMCEGLPDRPFGVTTPLFYVNADPHLGSAYTTMAVDALTRSLKMADKKPVMVTGCDEHGDKIRLSAEKAGKEPQEHCDEVSEKFRALFEKIDINYDRFVRTSSPRHEKIVLEFIERVWESGDIYKSEYEGLYCTGCEEYKDQKDLLEGDSCPIHLTKCEPRKEENYFFALSKYQERLEELIEGNPDFVQPERSRNEVLGWVKSGVRDFSISRANNPWGIPIPRDESQTIYVWFDALLGYVSALLDPNEEPTLENALARGWPAGLHLIGKDILRFHAIYWPAMLMSAGLPVPKSVFGHGFLTKDGMKMGKSLGNTIDPFVLVDQFGSDAVRYYFLRSIEFGQDGDYSEERFVSVVNADLANNLGNLLNRSLNLLKKNCNLTLEMDSSEIEHPLRNTSVYIAPLIPEKIEKLNFSGACHPVVQLLGEANLFIAQEEPWAKFKSGDREAAVSCLTTCLETVRISAVLLKPVTPSLSLRIYKALGFGAEAWEEITWNDAQWGQLRSGHVFPKPAPVFPRLEAKEAAVSS